VNETIHSSDCQTFGLSIVALAGFQCLLQRQRREGKGRERRGDDREGRGKKGSTFHNLRKMTPVIRWLAA